jgi:hypothetical protein
MMKLTLVASALIVLSSCGVTKSAEPALNSNAFSSSSIKPLASCNKTATADLSLSSAAIQNQVGQVDSNWLKVKFNFLSTKLTATNNIVKFFKWKTVNGQTYLDQTPLTVYSYNLSSGVTSTNPANQLTASSINAATGFYVQLNDAQGTYQVLKAVVYSADGKVVSQTDSLIPQFNAKAGDYQYNSDGSARSANLQTLHPLAAINAASWSDAQYDSYFQALCF